MDAILATQNEGKFVRCADIFSKCLAWMLSRVMMGLPKDEIEETGTNLEAKPYIKRFAIAKQCDG